MADKNKSKLIIGLSLIIVSFVCVAVILYFIGRANRMNVEKLSSLEVQLANLIAEKAEGQMSQSDFNRVKRTPINEAEFLSRAESIYGKGELDRKEGILWIDRKSSLYMITLGAVNGLKAGSNLSIYEGDTKIGDVAVHTPFDIISYVQPVGKSLVDLNKNYYRVVVKNLP